MVPKRGKSKRLSCAQKYKIQRKVREHNRKLRKDAKKNPNQQRKSKKDPGIPKMFPFKDNMIEEMEERKRQDQVDKEKLKSQKSAASSIASLMKSAAQRGADFEAKMKVGSKEKDYFLGEAAVEGTRDNSKKAYYKEFKKVVEAADVILEVLDARDPMGCRTKQIEEMIMASGVNKRLILVLNKIDLVPREVVEQWLKYLRNEFPAIAFKASTQTQRNHLSQRKTGGQVAPENLLGTSECLGADNLMKLLKNYCRNANIKTSISVGVIGFPNVGKSSVINSLKRAKVCNVGSAPGLTKSLQEIHLDKNIKLIDCPGIVFSKAITESEQAQVMLRNCVKVELLDDPITPVELIVSKCNRQQLINMYNIKEFVDVRDFLVQVARQRGRIQRGGIPNLEAAAKSVLQDWNLGRIPFYTVPPTSGPAVDTHVSSAIVTEWAQEFDLNEMLENEKDQINKTVLSKSEMNIKMMALKSSDAMANVDFDAVVMSEEEDIDTLVDVEDEDNGEEFNEADMDSEEMMENDEELLPTHVILDRQPKKKSDTSTVRPEKIFNEHERTLNPQTNKEKKKLQKQMKKEQKRQERMNASNMMNDDDDMIGNSGHSYDFSKLMSTMGSLPEDEDM